MALALSFEPDAEVQKEERKEIEEEKREDQGEKESAADFAVASFEEAFTHPTSLSSPGHRWCWKCTTYRKQAANLTVTSRFFLLRLVWV